MNNWKYFIEVSSKDVFDEIEEKYNVKLSEELRAFFVAHNAATPDNHCFKADGREHVFGATLSVNRGEDDTDTIYTAFAVMQNGSLVPFGIDPFGNYICLSGDKVVFWNHENGGTEATGLDLSAFIDSLY